jgi:hypothetical protein
MHYSNSLDTKSIEHHGDNLRRLAGHLPLALGVGAGKEKQSVMRSIFPTA